MKKLFFLPVFFLLFFPLSAGAADVFFGTLVIQDARPMLVRCDLVKNTYFLEDADGAFDVWLGQLETLGISPETPYEAAVYGNARMEGERVILVVDSIEDIRPGSCHLGDMFK